MNPSVGRMGQGGNLSDVAGFEVPAAEFLDSWPASAAGLEYRGCMNDSQLAVGPNQVAARLCRETCSGCPGPCCSFRVSVLPGCRHHGSRGAGAAGTRLLRLRKALMARVCCDNLQAGLGLPSHLALRRPEDCPWDGFGVHRLGGPVQREAGSPKQGRRARWRCLPWQFGDEAGDVREAAAAGGAVAQAVRAGEKAVNTFLARLPGCRAVVVDVECGRGRRTSALTAMRDCAYAIALRSGLHGEGACSAVKRHGRSAAGGGVGSMASWRRGCGCPRPALKARDRDSGRRQPEVPVVRARSGRR